MQSSLRTCLTGLNKKLAESDLQLRVQIWFEMKRQFILIWNKCSLTISSTFKTLSFVIGSKPIEKDGDATNSSNGIREGQLSKICSNINHIENIILIQFECCPPWDSPRQKPRFAYKLQRYAPWVPPPIRSTGPGRRRCFFEGDSMSHPWYGRLPRSKSRIYTLIVDGRAGEGLLRSLLAIQSPSSLSWAMETSRKRAQCSRRGSYSLGGTPRAPGCPSRARLPLPQRTGGDHADRWPQERSTMTL